MFGGLGMPIPYLSNKPGPGRPGWGPAGTYDFQFEVDGAVAIKAQPYVSGQSFTIKWPDGSTQTTTGSNSIAAPNSTAGVVSINNELDNTYCDDFQVVGGQDKVLKVLSWGQNPWSNVFEAFKDCTSLTDISTTSFLASGQGPNNNQGCYMESMFEGCTSLLEIDMRSWDLTQGVSWRNNGPFINMANLQKLDGTGLKIKLKDNASYSYSAFTGIGTNVPAGCEFKLSGLDLSTSPYNYIYLYMFAGNKFKDGSNLSNIKWPAGGTASTNYAYGKAMFQSSSCDGTLDCSGWTTWNSFRSPEFVTFNHTNLNPKNLNSKINLSNLALNNTYIFNTMFSYCGAHEIIGLNTWGATAGGATLESMFANTNYMRINPSDNFSSAFTSSLNPIIDTSQGGSNSWKNRKAFTTMCQGMGSGLLDSEVGVSPSFANVDFTDSSIDNYSIFYRFGYGAKLINTPDLTTAVFSSSVRIRFSNMFERGATITDTNNHFVLNNENLKISSLSQMNWGSNMQKLTIGDNVDLSALTSFGYMSYGASWDTGGITLPSNADYSSLTDIGTYAFSNGSLSTCQVDTFIRQNWATNLNTGLTCDLENNKITAAPSIARSNAASLSSVRTWNITLGSPDTALPFAYPKYMVDPSSTTSLTPSTLPPLADRNFSSTNAGVTVNQTTGVLSWTSGFEGFTTVKCTYADGCYNEVGFGVQVPFTFETLVPANGSQYRFALTGDQYVEYGDGTAENNSGSFDHTYSASGNGFGTWRTIKIFDQSETKKFTGISASSSYNFNPSRQRMTNILKWGSIVWSYFSFRRNMNVIGLRNEASDYPKFSSTLNTLENCFNFYSDLEQINSGRYDINTQFVDPNNSLNSWKLSTASGSLGNITSLKYMFLGNSMLGKSIVNPRNASNFNWSFNGATATAGTYGSPNYSQSHYKNGIYTTTVTGSGQAYSLGFYIIIDGTGTVNLDSNNFHAIPTFRRPGVDFQVGDQIKFNAGDFGGLSQAITLTFGTDDILNSSQTSANLNNWDTSNVTDFEGAFTGNLNTFGTPANKVVVNLNNWNLSSAISLKNFGGGEYNTTTIYYSGSNFAPKAVSAVDSPTGIAYTAWDTSNITDFTNIKYLGDNIPGVLKYWRFNTSSNVNLFRFLNGRDLSSFVSLADEPCKTQVIASGDAGNPYGIDYTAWNMEKASNLSNFAYRTSSNTGISNFEILTPALSSWQISDSLTSFNNFAAKASGVSTFTPTVGSWDPSGVTGANIWNYTDNGDAWKFSTSAYDNLLDITSGWGQHASTVNTGVTLNMGDSQYSPGNVIVVTWTGNNNSSGPNTLKTNNFNLQAATSIGDIIYFPASVGTTTTAYARITGYNSTDEATTTTTNWPTGSGSNRTFQIYDSNAAKGRFALLEAGWTIIDGGAKIPFDSTEVEIDVQNVGDVMRFGFQYLFGATSTHIDWGDGNGFSSTPYTGAFAESPAYNTTGTKTIKLNKDLSDSFSGFYFAYAMSASQKQMLTKIKKWGTNPYLAFYRAFLQATNLIDIEDTDSPNLNSVVNAEQAFNGCSSLTTFDFSNWTLPASLSSISGVFLNCQSITASSFDTITNWDVSNIENFGNLFKGCALMNSDISNWDVSSATNLSYMFHGASVFNQNISEWNTSNVTDMNHMFAYTTTFNQDISTKIVGSGASAYIAWDTYNVDTITGMFWCASGFDQDIGNWNVSGVDTQYGLSGMFASSYFVPYDVPNSNFNPLRQKFNNGGQPMLTKQVTIGSGTPVSKTYLAWDVVNNGNFGNLGPYGNQGIGKGMFDNAQLFNQDISNWHITVSTSSTSYGTPGRLNYMFRGAANFNQDITTKTISNVPGKGTYTAWDFSGVIGAEALFGPYAYGPGANINQDFSSWQLNSSLTSGNFNAIFQKTTSFNGQQFEVDGMSTANYTDTFVGWANQAKNNNNMPTGLTFSLQQRMTFDSNRSGGANFANAWEARSYLTNTISNGGLGWTISSDTVTTLIVPSTSSLQFNGSEYISVGRPSNLILTPGTDDITISAYFKTGASGCIYSFDAPSIPSQTRIKLGIEGNDGKIEATLNGNSSGQIPSGSDSYNDDDWYHVALTCAAGASTATIYINGSSVGTVDIGPGNSINATEGGAIGARTPSSPGFYFNGKIDEVMIWNTVLTQANIQTLANAVGSGNIVNPEQLSTGLQLWNRMGD